MLPFGPTFLSLKVRLEDRILKQESEGGLDRLGGEKMKLDQEQRVLIEKLFLEMINPLSAYAKKFYIITYWLKKLSKRHFE